MITLFNVIYSLSRWFDTFSVRAGHLLCDQPTHGHSDGGESGKSADGEHCMRDRTIYQEYRFKQGQPLFFTLFKNVYPIVLSLKAGCKNKMLVYL